MNEDYVQDDGYQQLLKEQGVCCITGLPLANSQQIHLVMLKAFANWPYPVWGDFSLGTNARAIAAVSDEACNADGLPIGIIKKAIEVKNGTITYHDVNETIYNGVRTINTPAT